jgi:hypothetical protein
VSSQPGAACANWGAALVGRFCHRCGQEAVERRMPLRRLVAEALGDLFAFDSRLTRTLRPLLLRPGWLTVEWCRGRRAAYVPPLRLYVFVAALFFLAMAATDVALVQVTASEGGVPLTAEEVRSRRAAEAAASPAVAGQRRGFEDALTAAWERDPDAFQDTILDRLGRLSLLLAPVSALLVGLLYLGRRRYLVEHLVFTLHLHAFAFLVLSLVLAAPRQGGLGLAVRLAAIAILLVYLLVALRRVYGGRWWIAALRAAAFACLYLLLVVLPTLFLSVVWAAWTA